MDYTYNLMEIRKVIDNWLQYRLDTSVHFPDQESEQIEVTANKQDTSEQSPTVQDTHSLSVVEKNQQTLQNWSIVDLPLTSSTPVAKAHRRENNIAALAETESQELSESKTSKTSNSSMELLGERESTDSERFSSKDDMKLDNEDMSLKLVLTYFYYMDTSTDSTDKPAEEASSAMYTDDLTNTETHSSSGNSETDSHSDIIKSSDRKESCDSDADFDADIDSLGHSDADSYKLASFSMMNIFDSTCDTNYALSGSLDFKQLCRDPCSDSDKDTLDWLSDSSEEDCKSEDHEEIDRVLETDSSDNKYAETFTSSMCSSALGQTQSSELSGLSETKRYSGSTYSISKCNSEIRHKLVKRLFRKVFPSKKYVVNK